MPVGKTSANSSPTKTAVGGKPAIGQSVGIANLPNQLHRIVSKRGLDYNILLLGSSGLGKATFLNCLLGFDFMPTGEAGGEYVKSGTTLQPKIYCQTLIEKGKGR